MKRTLSQLYNHKLKYPGSVSAYSVKVKITSNATDQRSLNEAFMDIMPGLERYLGNKGFLLETELLKRKG
jgi:hypothetical protein